MLIVKYRDSAVSCANVAGPIEMQFGMPSHVGPGNTLHGDVSASTERELLGCLTGWKGIVKHRILAVGKSVSCAKNGWNDLYVV